MPTLLRRIATAAVVAAGLLLQAGSAPVHAEAAPSATNQANLDFAIEIGASAWCTEPKTPAPPARPLPATVEGWFSANGAPAEEGVLFELRDPGGRTVLGVFTDPSGRITATVGRAAVRSEPGEVKSGVWTHYVLRVAEDGLRLSTWNMEQGERHFSARQPPTKSSAIAMRVCVGGEATRTHLFRGVLDEVRLWRAVLSDEDLRAWRHRRISQSHPQASLLLGYWPFRAGSGATEPGLARLGPLTSTEPRWVDLPRLDFGPILRSVDARSARFLFHARRGDGREVEWRGAVELGPTDDFGSAAPASAVTATERTDFVAHVEATSLSPGTSYTYVPLVEGRRAFDADPSSFPSFRTAAGAGGRNVDFTATFFADQHTFDRPEVTPLEAYTAAARDHPLFWAQLGDVDPGNHDHSTEEQKRNREMLQAIWERNYGTWDSPQARFARSFPLNIATLSDHEIADNYSLNWHLFSYGTAATPVDSTLRDRVAQYDASLARWWNYFGWGMKLDDRLGRVAQGDHGESVMAETAADVLEDTMGRRVCLGARDAPRFPPGSFAYLEEASAEPFASRIAAGEPASCAGGAGTTVTLEGDPPHGYRKTSGARLGIGARYASHGFYQSYQPYPFVEFFVLDTTSYRGDPYEKFDVYAKDANRDTDHSRYPWNPTSGSLFIFGDRQHGANQTTDRVRSWLGPTQKQAFLRALADSTARVVVIAAGYPLYSSKFERSDRYWEGRESGFDYATEIEEITSALEALDKLVIWIHGDGHTPENVRLRRNVYQLQIGATFLTTGNPGYRSRRLVSGTRSKGDSLGGGFLISGHQPDLDVGNEADDFFAGHLDQFRGYLRLHFHPGTETLRSSDLAGLKRVSDREIEIAVKADPARGDAARLVVGKVARLRFGETSRYSATSSYRYEDARAVFTFEDPIVTSDPDELAILVDSVPWVEGRWFDSRGHEWRDFAFVFRKDL